jgi:hypothetical protein
MTATKGADMIRTDHYGRLKPITEETWERVGKGRYAHVTGIEVVKRANSNAWEIVGGAEDGYCYTTLSIAQHSAFRHFKAAV